MANDKEKLDDNMAQEEREIAAQGPAEQTQTDEAPKEEPKSELDELREQNEALKDQHLRLMAEYDNFRKRSQREKEEIYRNATSAALEKFLPVQDNFDRARQFRCDSEEFAKGFAMIEKDFCELLSSFGVESFGEAGETFDPQKHHAVMHVEDEALGENVVSQVLQKGYRMGDRILRYAMVQTAN